MSKCQSLQFFKCPLEAVSKFTAEINMVTGWYKKMVLVSVANFPVYFISLSESWSFRSSLFSFSTFNFCHFYFFCLTSSHIIKQFFFKISISYFLLILLYSLRLFFLKFLSSVPYFSFFRPHVCPYLVYSPSYC